eukprot:TRINITY_DN5584_c0_g1_i1.p2 TRINITY_DN5584_c0_g1~~TRINITY_DN5584_c0_g1_i1.p2  ORF type:complete len:109 (+),score=3.98 TRINITY_DN5584_c0_g1_i1:173-499(+)
MQLNKSSDGSEEPLRKRRKTSSEKEDDDSSDDSMLDQRNSRNALRFSQVERFLGTASEVESNVLGMSSSDLVWGDQEYVHPSKLVCLSFSLVSLAALTSEYSCVCNSQ